MVVFPIPSCPLLLLPQPHTVPSDFRASEKLPPAVERAILPRPSGYNGNREVTGLPECAPNQLLKTWVRTQTVEGWLDIQIDQVAGVIVNRPFQPHKRRVNVADLREQHGQFR